MTDKIILTEAESGIFADLTEDYNPIHRDEAEAQSSGFKTTPVLGSHTFALFGYFGTKTIADKIDRDLKLVEQTTRFRQPIYPGEEIIFSNRIPNGNPGIEMMAQTNGKPAAKTTLRFSEDYGAPEITERAIFTKDYDINSERIDRLFQVFPEWNGSAMKSLASALMPSTLLYMLNKKGREMKGTNLSMSVRYFGDPTRNEMQVDIERISEPKRMRSGFMYNIDAACRQFGSIKAKGTITCYSEEKI